MKTNIHTRISLTNDDTRDITIRIMDHLITTRRGRLLQVLVPIGASQYPFDLQDEIHGIINEALEVEDE